MRNLATIQKIEKLLPIDGADRIETAIMQDLGWECIVKKGDFKIGDLVIYVEIDSVLPDKPEFEFMRSRKFRIKTIKLKGQVSQGLILPITLLTKPSNTIGKDVTEQLGITKYDPEAVEESKSQGKSKKSLKWIMMHHRFTRWLMNWSFINSLVSRGTEDWPSWVVKTDETRIQSIPKVLDKFKDEEIYITEKVDGQSASYTLATKKKFLVMSRNRVNNNPNSNYGKIAAAYNLKKLFKTRYSVHTVLQGEILGPKIQKNKYEFSELKFLAYNLINSKGKFIDYAYMEPELKLNGIESVPLVYRGKLSNIGTTVAEWVEYSKGNSVLNPSIPREGIVVRVVKDGRKVLSFKVINPDFLLKYKL